MASTRYSLLSHAPDLDAFFRAYVAMALSSSLDDEGEPLAGRFTGRHLTDDAKRHLLGDCMAFLRETEGAILRATIRTPRDRFAQAGHDFWLTRNHHGAGFWDGDWSKPEADLLTRVSRKFGEQHLYAQGGRLHVE